MLHSSISSRTRQPTMPVEISRKPGKNICGYWTATTPRWIFFRCLRESRRNEVTRWREWLLGQDTRTRSAASGCPDRKGRAASQPRRLDEAVQCFAVAGSIAPENDLVLSNLAVALADSGRRHEALAEFHRVVELRPDNIHARHQMRRLTSTIVPFWLIPMLNDARRNDAFERAICEAVERPGPDARILDIGSGSGLLSMMAARAGPRISFRARRSPSSPKRRSALLRSTAMKSRYASSTRVRDSSSSVRISKRPRTFSFRRYCRATCWPRIFSLPSKTRTRGFCARMRSSFRARRPRSVAWWRVRFFRNPPLSGLCRGLTSLRSMRCRRNVFHCTACNVGATFAGRGSPHDRLDGRATSNRNPQLSVSVLEDGIAIGIVEWINVDLGDGVTFSNHPSEYSGGGWLQILHTFPQPVAVSAGSQLDVMVGNDRTSLIVALAPGSGPVEAKARRSRCQRFGRLPAASRRTSRDQGRDGQSNCDMRTGDACHPARLWLGNPIDGAIWGRFKGDARNT